jgi:hypothetical protein
MDEAEVRPWGGPQGRAELGLRRRRCGKVRVGRSGEGAPDLGTRPAQAKEVARGVEAGGGSSAWLELRVGSGGVGKRPAEGGVPTNAFFRSG